MPDRSIEIPSAEQMKTRRFRLDESRVRIKQLAGRLALVADEAELISLGDAEMRLRRVRQSIVDAIDDHAAALRMPEGDR